jgi:hypothetical protein
MNKFLIGLATVIHLIPHPFGVSPIGATALYAGAYGSAGRAWLVPLVPLLAAGLVFGFDGPIIVLAFVFAGFALSALIGRRLLAQKKTALRFGSAVGISATVFFLVSNFSIWFVGYYPPTVEGLVQCYVNGLPFLLMAAATDAAYCVVLFGLHELVQRSRPLPASAAVA